MRVLYVNVLPYGAHPGIDALAHGLDDRLRQARIDLRTLTIDVRQPDWVEKQTRAIQQGIDARVDGIVVYVLDPAHPARAVAAARGRGIPVFTLERPRYAVNAALVYPNFNHGVYMAEHLASLLPAQAEVAVIGGPEVIDDIELVLGIVHGVQRSGLQLVNDPFTDRHRNREDVQAGGREAARRVLADFAHLDGLIPFNDETMLGTLEAIDEAGRAGEMKLVSRNGSPKAVEAVIAARSHGTWDIEITTIGAAVGELVTRVLVGGENLQDELAIAPLGRMITAENVHTYRPWSVRVPYVPLIEGLD
ncbi:MAG TPA: substrate-binding domain-containing protein [Candidatus Binatia bacterium]|nr:substrate-binding domain-containing protein [Candidatus Binatia bacterium]